MAQSFKLAALIALLQTAAVALCFAHGGGLDAQGGHQNRKTGEYHYHRKTSAPAPTSSYSKSITTYKQQHSQLSATEIETRIYAYFRKANENVGALNCNLAKHERDVSQSTKDYVKRRDGSKCVICSSTYKLEVDHIRALMNGGTNHTSNLATLCDDCHTKKTRLDKSLRRKRDKVCR